MKKEIDIALEFALKNEYESVLLYEKWNETNVYVAENIVEGEEVPIIGYPALIIVSESNPRFATPEETFSIMSINPINK